jgi:amidase
MTTLPLRLPALAACLLLQVTSALAQPQGEAQPLLAGPAEVATRTALARIQQLDPTLQSVLALEPAALDEAQRLDRQRSARGPLHGLTLLVKDALDRNPCGSSSGSAVAVAAGLVDAALGTETDGSITCPAAVNGVVGLKPTVGLVSRSRIVPLALSQDTAGPMARDVATVARLLTAMAGRDAGDVATVEADTRRQDYAAGLEAATLRGVRLGVLRFGLGWSAAVDAAFERGLALLRERGAVLVDVTEGPDLSAMANAGMTVLLGEFRPQIDAYLATTPPAVTTRSLADLMRFNREHAAREMPLFAQELFEQALQAPGPETPQYREARATALRLADAEGVSHLLRKHEVEALLLPTAPMAWKIDAINGDQTPYGLAGSMAAIAGTPHLTVPMSQHWGLPLGMSFLGPRWGEARLLQLGAAFEQARGLLPAPTLPPSIEAGAVVAPMLVPAKALP